MSHTAQSYTKIILTNPYVTAVSNGPAKTPLLSECVGSVSIIYSVCFVFSTPAIAVFYTRTLFINDVLNLKLLDMPNCDFYRYTTNFPFL